VSLAELSSEQIDRNSPVPFYFQLQNQLVEQIVSGAWKVGDRLPSEPAICEHFGVSRTTVRQALAELESEGLIRKEKGRGTFIAQPRSSWLLQSAHGFYDEAARTGHTVTSRVLRREIEELPEWACEALKVSHGCRGLTLERLRWVDGRIAMYVITHLPLELSEVVFAADLERGSLYQVLEERAGLVVVGGRRVVEAVRAEDGLAALLEVDSGAPLLFVESASWNAQAQPFECYRAWHRADRTKIEVHVAHEEIVTKAGISAPPLRIAT
jgi:GntR family transcriptional regulator